MLFVYTATGLFIHSKIWLFCPSVRHNKFKFYLKTATNLLLAIENDVHLTLKTAKDTHISNIQHVFVHIQ